MLKRSTSLMTTLCAALALVSMVTLLEFRVAKQIHAAGYTASNNTLVDEFDFGYQEPPTGPESDFGPGNYWHRVSVVPDAPTAFVELFRDGRLISSGYVPATHQHEPSYASSESMGVAMMATTATAGPSSPSPSPSPSPSTPPPSPSPSPSPSPKPSASPSPSPSPLPSLLPGQFRLSIGTSGFGIGYSRNGDRYEFGGGVEIDYRGGVTGRIDFKWRF